MATYTAELTADQLIDFSTLVRRLVRADGTDGQPLRQDIADALIAFDTALPDVSDQDSDQWLAAAKRGLTVDWEADQRPITGSR
jgi:hypothetical protein